MGDKTMNPLARIVFRENGDINKPDLILGVCFVYQDLFKGNEVWEIHEILGELILKKVGQSVINSGEPIYTWNRTINDLLSIGKTIYLTTDEYKQLIKEQND
jgi:hypothetical protein